jgi:hypothetical protein
MALRIAADLALNLLFQAFAWTALRVGLTMAVLLVLQAVGAFCALASETALSVGDMRVSITTRCTYLDMALWISPFLMTSRHLARGAGIWLLTTGLILCGNVMRIVAACLVSGSICWFWAHDLPDYAIRSIVLILVLLRYLHIDRPAQSDLDRCGVGGCHTVPPQPNPECL